MEDIGKLTTRVALYARVSSEEQKEGQTIDSQVAELERFARERAWQIAGTYKDEGWSGAILARPALDELRDEASKGKFNAVLINDVDRLARDVAHLGIIKRDLERRGVNVIFRKLPAENNPTTNLMVNILGSFAEFEREMILDRTRRGRKHKVEVRKQYMGSISSYGYDYIPKDKSGNKEGQLKINLEQALVVKQMYEWVDKEGISALQVVAKLNQLQILPRKANRLWAKSTVLTILRNEMYAGIWYYYKHKLCPPIRSSKEDRYKLLKTSSHLRPKSEWLPVELPEHLRIIDRSQWERVQQHISNNRGLCKRNSKQFYLLKGMVKCGGCQATYCGTSCHGKFYYRCNNRCKAYPSITQHILEEAVLQAVTTALLNPELIMEQVKLLIKEESNSQEKAENQQQDINTSLTQIEQEESRMLEAYRLGAVTALQLGQEMEKINNRKSLLLEKREQLLQKQQVPPIEVVEKSITNYCQQVTQKLESLTEEEKQKLLNLLIEKIIFKGEQIEVKAIVPFSQPSSENKAENKNPFEVLFNKYAEQNNQILLQNPLRIEATGSEQQNNTLSREQSSIANAGTDSYVLNSTQSNFLVQHCIVSKESEKYCGRNVTYTMNIKVDYYFDKLIVKGFIISIDHPVNLKPKPYLGDYKVALEKFLLKQPQATLQNLCDHIKKHANIKINVPSMHRVVQKLDLPFKTNQAT